MARIYANENIPLQVVKELRRLGHDVLTSHEAGKVNRGYRTKRSSRSLQPQGEFSSLRTGATFRGCTSGAQWRIPGSSCAPMIRISPGKRSESTKPFQRPANRPINWSE
jgi:hypothetical protein